MPSVRSIILASSSPRRKEILEKTGLRFKVDPGGYEESVSRGMKPRELARALSRAKAWDAARRHRNSLVISADTLVVLGDRIFGKPRNREDAGAILKSLSGRTHSVITGFTILDAKSGKEICRSVVSKISFKRLTPGEIEAYIGSGEPLDKAGAYGIQGLGALFVKKIEGDFFNVMGLPLHALAETLKKFGITILGQDDSPE